MKYTQVALWIALIVPMGVRSLNAQDTVQLFSVHKDGIGLKVLSRGFIGIGQATFGPDGSKLVFGASFFDVPRDRCPGIGGVLFPNGKIFFLNSDGSDLHEIHGYSSAFTPIFTPDGKKILFTGWDESAGTCMPKLLGMYSMNLDGTGATLIVRDATETNISADGSRIVFCRTDSSRPSAFISNSDGSDAKVLARGRICVEQPFGGMFIFNPGDRSEIMFHNRSSISTINVDTLAWRSVFQGPNRPNQMRAGHRTGAPMPVEGADYSPNGRSVVFSAMLPAVDHFEIYEISADGTGMRQITDNALSKFPYGSADPLSPPAYTQAYSPTYSPDGKTIVFVGRTGR